MKILDETKPDCFLKVLTVNQFIVIFIYIKMPRGKNIYIYFHNKKRRIYTLTGYFCNSFSDSKLYYYKAGFSQDERRDILEEEIKPATSSTFESRTKSFIHSFHR